MTTATAAKPERHLASHIFNIAVLAVGGIGLAVMMHRLGLTTAEQIIEGVGGWFAVIFALDVAALGCDAAAIHAFMRPEARMVSYWRVFAAQASGRAINILTPGGALGEATKITMLVSHAPRTRVVSSIVMFNLATFYLSIAIVLIGVPITTLVVGLPHQLEIVVWIGLAVLIPLGVGLYLLIRRGALGTVLDGAVKLNLLRRARADGLAGKLAEFDRHLRELSTDRSPGTWLGFALLVVSRVLVWSATTVLLHAIGDGLRAPLLVGLFSMGILIGWMSSIVPLGLGIADGSNYALFKVLGALPGDGVLYSLLNRVRSLALAVVGLAIMAAGHTANRISLVRRNRRVAQLRDHRAGS